MKKTNWSKIIKNLYHLNNLYYHDKKNKENTEILINFLNENFEKLYWEYYYLNYNMKSNKKYKCLKWKNHDKGEKNE